jgi:NADH-quinone oxidoreductase subunit M
MSGFVSEVMVFLGSFKSTLMPHAKVFTILGTLGVVFGAVYILTMLQKVFLGTPKEVGGHGDAHGDGHGHAVPALAPSAHPDAAAHGDDAHGAGGHGGGGHDHYHPPKAPWPDLQPVEWATLLPLAAVTIVLGILPSLALDIFNPTVVALLDRMAQVRGALGQ